MKRLIIQRTKGVSRQQVDRIAATAADIQKRYLMRFYASFAIPYAHSLDVMDAAEDAKLLRQQVKREWNRYDTLCRERIENLHRDCEPSFWCLLQDFGVRMGEILADDVTMLRLACKSVLDGIGERRADLLGYTEAVNIMWYAARVNIQHVMDEARKKTGFNLMRLPSFRYVKLDDICRAWDNFTDTLSGGKGCVDFGDNERVVACIENLVRKMYGADAMGKANKEAFLLNEKYLAAAFGDDFVDAVKVDNHNLT